MNRTMKQQKKIIIFRFLLFAVLDGLVQNKNESLMELKSLKDAFEPKRENKKEENRTALSSSIHQYQENEKKKMKK